MVLVRVLAQSLRSGSNGLHTGISSLFVFSAMVSSLFCHFFCIPVCFRLSGLIGKQIFITEMKIVFCRTIYCTFSLSTVLSLELVWEKVCMCWQYTHWDKSCDTLQLCMNIAIFNEHNCRISFPYCTAGSHWEVLFAFFLENEKSCCYFK